MVSVCVCFFHSANGVCATPPCVYVCMGALCMCMLAVMCTVGLCLFVGGLFDHVGCVAWCCYDVYCLYTV